MTELEIFLSDAQSVAERGIARMEAEMLSSFTALLEKPVSNYKDYDFSMPDIPVIPDYVGSATYQPYSFNPHVSHVWDTTEMNSLQQKVFDALSSGGIGLSQSLQDAIFQSDRERKLQVLSDSLQAVDAGMGAKGFRLPNDMLKAARNEVIQKYQFDLENQSREITKLMEEHARINWQFCVEKGISSEQFHADFTTRYDQMFIEMKRAAVEQYRLEVEAEVAVYKSKIEGIIARLNAYKARADVSVAGMNAQIEKAKLELDTSYKSASIAIESYKASGSKQIHAYDAYAKLVQSFAQTATGGLLTIQKV